MVVDFLGVLKEDEVHLGFSSKFSDEQSGFSETFLHGMDVLVARSPAHYPSDVQRVKAVLKPELGALKDAIVFPTTGNTPLADKLSGGDYDGDMAWVCWEPTIVDNFQNAALPDVPDLFKEGILSKDSQTYHDLVVSLEGDDDTTEFLDQAMRFNMESNLLGTCTNYKEKLCYSRRSVRDEPAIFLSTLISHLVDRAKQGILFTEQEWNPLRKKLNGDQADPQRAKSRLDPLLPQYKNTDYRGNDKPTHIIDFVKFCVGKPTVEAELKALDIFLSEAKHWDKDLVRYSDFYEKFQRTSNERKKANEAGNFKRTSWGLFFDRLKRDIDDVASVWNSTQGEFEVKLWNAYDKWRNVLPKNEVNHTRIKALQEGTSAAVGLSPWDLLKASYCYKMYYRRSPSFPWHIAGRQLAYLKAMRASDADAPPILMTPLMYAGSRPDASFARGRAALNEGRRLETVGEGAEENARDEDV
ncbi:Uu.00g002450.m01.CDS01 [Anthostomella pinea]|uniref:RNA-dependent RNA polymerase n=1 Tax=Anthostomella pinea TaxID=933095 RepID=A0AAI8VKQ1_9PEZI|nr:Uu.00g002450.m01.CDS01 [Anthostomella pinea]